MKIIPWLYQLYSLIQIFLSMSNEDLITLMNKQARSCFLILGGGTIFKPSSMKDVSYVPMQNDWDLTNTQTGLSSTVYMIIQTTGLFLSLYIADRYSKKILLPSGLIGVGLRGLYLVTLSSFTGYLICFAAMAPSTDVVYQSALLKVARLLGAKEEQGCMFGLLEAGRGVADVIVVSGVPFVFVQLGGGKAGMQAGLLLYTVITLVAGIVMYFTVDDNRARGGKKTSTNMEVLKGIKYVLFCSNAQLASSGIFFVYVAYCGLTYFIPFLKDIYMLPVAFVGAYGTINQYALKMVGEPIGGMLVDEVAKSPTMYLRWMLLISVVAMLVFMQLSYQTMNVYVGMAATLGFGAIIFSQRAIFFTSMDEIGTPREYAGPAMASGYIIGYIPTMFTYTLYGCLLDTNSGITGYNYVFSVMIVFSLMGFVCLTILVK